MRAVVDANAGTVVETIDYDAWGNATVNDTTCAAGAACAPFQPFGFAGGLSDRETGLVRFGARDYDPSVGRWTQKDPIRFDGKQSNIYVYVGDDPIKNGADRSGLTVYDCSPFGSRISPSYLLTCSCVRMCRSSDWATLFCYGWGGDPGEDLFNPDILLSTGQPKRLPRHVP